MASTAMSVHKMDPMALKKVAPPLSLSEFLTSIAQPLASAKSAIDHMKNHTVAIPEMM